MLKSIKKIYNPQLYHGHNKDNQNFFEGWYFKIADKKLENVYAFIPGVFKDKAGHNTHSFIQVMEGPANKSHFIKYDFNHFKAAKHRFDIKIVNNKFSLKEMNLDINSENIKIQGNLNFKNIKPWPVSVLSPGAMGWYGFLPFMECNHGVLSFNHEIKGQLNINSQTIDFTGGRGYIEKDWGKSFPSAWLWLQTNHFNDPTSSLMVSIATIPWLSREFRGFIIGFYHQDELYKFTTYNNSIINQFEKKDDKILVEVENSNFILKIAADYEKGLLLKGPFRSNMVKNVEESLNASIEIKLINKFENSIIYQGMGQKAGFELNGNLDEIIDNY